MDLSSVFPHQYLQELLSLGVRADGRVPDVGRPITLNVGSISSCDGSALVRCGNTLVTCGVKVELVAGGEARQGIVVCNVECSSCCLPESNSGPPPAHVQVLTKQLQTLLHKFVDVDQLGVEDSDLVWVLHVDVVCLSQHGNLLDTCCLATTAALRNTVLPCVDVSASKPVLRVLSASTSVPLKVPGIATVSFALFDDWCLLDPVLEEERVAQGHCTISLSLHPQQVIGYQHQGKALSEQQISRLMDLAKKRASSLYSVLDTAK